MATQSNQWHFHHFETAKHLFLLFIYCLHVGITYRARVYLYGRFGAALRGRFVYHVLQMTASIYLIFYIVFVGVPFSFVYCLQWFMRYATLASIVFDMARYGKFGFFSVVKKIMWISAGIYYLEYDIKIQNVPILILDFAVILLSSIEGIFGKRKNQGAAGILPLCELQPTILKIHCLLQLFKVWYFVKYYYHVDFYAQCLVPSIICIIMVALLNEDQCIGIFGFLTKPKNAPTPTRKLNRVPKFED